MSNDLIRREDAEKIINDTIGAYWSRSEDVLLVLQDVLKKVQHIPATHDKDETVEQLEEQVLLIKEQLLDICEEDEEAVRLRCRMRGLDEAIEIVKSEAKG